MIDTIINLSQFNALQGKLLTLEESDKLLRTIADRTKESMAFRIHNEGKKTDGSNIGTYSKQYLAWRKKNGYSQQGDKVLLFLTGDMQNDFKVIAFSEKEYGIGFSNKVNGDKAQGLQYGNGKWKGYGEIYGLTTEELEQVNTIIEEELKIMFK
jgi:hypothetical protein